jgi:hypothetical protein
MALHGEDDHTTLVLSLFFCFQEVNYLDAPRRECSAAIAATGDATMALF